MQTNKAANLLAKLNHRFTLPVFCLVGTLVLTSVSLNATIDVQGGVDPLQPTAGQIRTTQEIVRSLSTRHYRDQEINDELSRRFLDKYLDSLDPSKSFFFASDTE